MEILAPANNSLKLIRQLTDAGADSIYFGVKSDKGGSGRLSLLWSQLEFAPDEALEAVKIISGAGKRSYIALNALYRDSDLESVSELACKMLGGGANAIILADPGLASLILRERPDSELHVSIIGRTLNSAGAGFWRRLGAKRVILERTLSLDEVQSIRERGNLEVELFIFGNFCFFYHGRCRISSYFYGEQCLGPCQEKFQIDSLHSPFERPFRSKPLNAYDLLPQIQKAGVAAIKIEGRQKTSRYILTAVKILRKAVDAIEAGMPLPPVSAKHLLFPMPPIATPGFLNGNCTAGNSTSDESGLLEFRRQMATYLTPVGLKIGWQMKRKRSRDRS